MFISPTGRLCALIIFFGLNTLNAQAQPDNPPPTTEETAQVRPSPFVPVDFDSVDTTGVFTPRPVPIKGYLLAATVSGKAPGAVLNPACEGLLAPGGAQIKGKYQRMARFLQTRGITVLLVDGFNPRGFTENCSHQKLDASGRMKDALGGLVYLRGRIDIAADQVVMVTWGNTGGFQAMNKGSQHLEKVGTGFMAAVMYYPECAKTERRFAPYAPILMFVGDKDAWNPAAPCQAMAQRQEAGSASFDLKIYPDTYHSFDQPFGEPRMNAFNPKHGMVGRNAGSVADSFKTIDIFLARFIQMPARNGAPPVAE